MSEVKDRLKSTSEESLKQYEVWSENKKDAKAREALTEAIHELRKVASRIEIELAATERSENTQKPIAIPPHRDARKRSNNSDNNSNGNSNNDNSGDNSDKKPRRTRAPRKAQGGSKD